MSFANSAIQMMAIPIQFQFRPGLGQANSIAILELDLELVLKKLQFRSGIDPGSDLGRFSVT